MQKYNWFGQVLNIIRIEPYLVYKVTIYNGTKWRVGGRKTNNVKISHHAWKHPNNHPLITVTCRHNVYRL